MEYARKCNADLLLATDPDCDRVGIAEHWVRPIKNGNLFESRKGFFFWTGYAYSPKSVVDAMLKELIYIQERIL